PGTFAHWDQVRDDLNQAIQLGWISDQALANALVSQLAAARQALDDQKGTDAKTGLRALIQTITASTPDQRRREAFDLIFLNTQRLIEGTADTVFPVEPKLKLTPQSSTLPVGTLYTLTGTVINAGDPANPPIPGFRLGFLVVEGPQGGQQLRGVTDAQGKLSFSYTGTQEGTDKITAGIFNEVINELGYAEVTWSGGPDLVVPLFAPPLLKSESGKTVFITEWTSNLGNVASSPSITRYFISADPQLDPSTAQFIGQRPIPALPPGEQIQGGTVTFTLTVDDGKSGSASDTVTITVADTKPPTVTAALTPVVPEKRSSKRVERRGDKGGKDDDDDDRRDGDDRNRNEFRVVALATDRCDAHPLMQASI